MYQGEAVGTLRVNKASQAIVFGAIGDQETTNRVGLHATGGGSGNAVTFAVASGPGSIAGGTNLTFTGEGRVGIVASQAGNGNWEAAPEVTNEFEVTKAVAGLTLTNLTQTYDGTPREATATTEPAGLDVVLTYDGSLTAPTGAGEYAVTGTVDDVMYQGEAVGTLRVNKADQVITNFPDIPDQMLTNVVVLTAQSSSGLPVVYAPLGPCAIDGNIMTFIGTGDVIVTAVCLGDDNWNDAPNEFRFFTVYPAVPGVDSPSSTGILAHSAHLGGTVTTNNGAPVTQVGVTWSTNAGFAPHAGVLVVTNGDFAAAPFSLSVSGLPAGTIVYFRALAANSAGTNFSAESWFLTRPDAPAVQAATAIEATTFDANWSASTGATNYLLDVSTTNDFSSFVPGYQNKAIGDGLTDGVTGLTAGRQYFYRLRASNASGVSTNSATELVQMRPPAPDILAASGIATNEFTANWNLAVSATNYWIDVSTTNDFSLCVPGYQDLSAGPVALQSVTGLCAGTEYFYRVRAGNESGVGGDSSTQVVWTVPSAPDVLPSTSNTYARFTANWSASTGATNYLLDVSTTNDFSSFVSGYQNRSVGLVSTCVVWGLDAGTEYFYRLRAQNSGGISIDSAAQSAWTVPPAPVALAANPVATNDFTANWSAAQSATNYFLDVSRTNAFTSFVGPYQNLCVGDATNCSVTGLVSGLRYYYRLRAQNDGGISSNSNVRSLTLAKANQVITNFDFIGDQVVTNVVQLRAQASSGLPMIFAGYGPQQIVGNTLTFTGTGEVTIVAAQWGNESWNAAIVSSQTFMVTAVMYTITPAADVNGTIDPDTAVVLSAGESTCFVVRADADYYIASVQTNGAEVRGAAGLYVFTSWWHNVQADGVVTASFASVQHNTASNGVPIPWLREYYTNSPSIDDLMEKAIEDTDADGIPAWQEYWAKTDPTDPLKYLHLTVIQNSFDVVGKVIRWASETGVVYGVERSDGLGEGSFLTVVCTNVLATPPLNVVTDQTAGAESTLYYRIRVERWEDE